MKSIFRKESIRAHEEKWLGQLSLSKPVPKYVLVVFIVFLVVSLISSLFLLSVRTKNLLNGVVITKPGIASVRGSVDGKVNSILIGDGEYVTENQNIVIVSNTRLSKFSKKNINKDELLDLRKEKREQLGSSKYQFEAQLDLLNNQKQLLSEEIKKFYSEINDYDELLIIEEETITIYKDSYEKGIISKDSYFDKIKQYKLQKINQSVLDRGLINKKSELNNINISISELYKNYSNEVFAIKQSIVDINKELQNINLQLNETIKAPKDGLLILSKISEGQSITKEQVLFNILPKDFQKVLEVSVPSDVRTYIHDDSEVYIRVNSYPYTKYGLIKSKVLDISQAPVVDNKQNEHYKMLLSLDDLEPKWSNKIKIGMTAEVVVYLDKRKLINWVFPALNKS